MCLMLTTCPFYELQHLIIIIILIVCRIVTIQAETRALHAKENSLKMAKHLRPKHVGVLVNK